MSTTLMYQGEKYNIDDAYRDNLMEAIRHKDRRPVRVKTIFGDTLLIGEDVIQSAILLLENS